MQLRSFFAAVLLSLAAGSLVAQEPVTFTTQEDHRNMMEQLGITKLRPGPSGNAQAPNAANYDESLANPFPNLPEVLKLNSGKAVTTPEMWWDERRPEIVEDFEREVLGRVPVNVPKVTWEVLETSETKIGETAAVQKRLQGKVDNSACPSIEVNIAMTLVTPKDAKEPVPVLMMFTFGFGGAGPGKRGGPAGKAKFAPMGPSRNEQLLEAGWGYATIVPASIQADNGAGLTRGIIGLTNLGQPRKPEDWGSLRAWAWGASRGLDYLETDAAVDAKRVGIEGVSRYGKAALVTMAMDTRFAMVLVGSSGEGGAKLHRRNFGEAVENLTGSGEYHWMAGNFLKYGAEESSFGKKNAGDIPVDAHQLIALCAPRLTFISYGIPERGDAKWLDQQGSYMAAVAAGPVFRLLGAKDLGTSDDYLKEKMPGVNVGLLEGELAWRQHDGGHTDGPNIEHFLAWANKKFAQRGEEPDDAKAMQGTWTPTKAELAGEPMPEAVLKTIVLKIDGDKYEVTVAGKLDRGTCALDTAAKPKRLTISGTEGPNKGKTYPCIYELSGDTLRVCYDLSGKAAPTEFKTTAGTQLYLVTYERKKE